MRKILFLGGVSMVGYAFYYYFKKQYNLAMNYAYKIKDVNVLNLTTKKATIDATVEITNKSNFQVSIDSYDLIFKFKGFSFAQTSSETPILVNPDSKFLVKAVGEIDFSNYKEILLPAVTDILQRKKIEIIVFGTMKVSFMGVSQTIEFDDRAFTYTEDLISDVGLSQKFEKSKGKVADILGKIGIKI